MEKNLYIDASHPNETRIILKSTNSIEEYEFEDKNNLTFKLSHLFFYFLCDLNIVLRWHPDQLRAALL